MDILKYVGKPTNDDGKESVQHAQHKRGVHRAYAFRQAMRKMLEGWSEYANAHRNQYETPIGDDGALGPYWGEIGLNIKRLLDGETGGYDCGSLASNITECIRLNGLETRDGYSLSEPVRSITVFVRRWWNKSKGHTLESYAIAVNGETVKLWEECEKGGASLAADEWLTNNGYATGDPIAVYCDKKDIAFNVIERKVSRKKDLLSEIV